jgi:hypothetical protein
MITVTLVILRPGTLCMFNAKKTRSLAMWAICNAQLSAVALQKSTVTLVEVLSAVLNDKDSDEALLGDSFKVCLASKTRHNSLTDFLIALGPP